MVTAKLARVIATRLDALAFSLYSTPASDMFWPEWTDASGMGLKRDRLVRTIEAAAALIREGDASTAYLGLEGASMTLQSWGLPDHGAEMAKVELALSLALNVDDEMAVAS